MTLRVAFLLAFCFSFQELGILDGNVTSGSELCSWRGCFCVKLYCTLKQVLGTGSTSNITYQTHPSLCFY